nr:hypothetical protein Iba_chr06dCG7390 [Ipomoea batatas]
MHPCPGEMNNEYQNLNKPEEAGMGSFGNKICHGFSKGSAAAALSESPTPLFFITSFKYLSLSLNSASWALRTLFSLAITSYFLLISSILPTMPLFAACNLPTSSIEFLMGLAGKIPFSRENGIGVED